MIAALRIDIDKPVLPPRNHVKKKTGRTKNTENSSRLELAK